MKKKKNVLRILAFDPGLSKTGWCVVDFDCRIPRLSIVKFGAFQCTSVAGKVAYNEAVNKYGLRMVTISLVREQQLQLFEHYQPDYVVCEDAFYNPSRPAAYLALIQWITTLETLMYDRGMSVSKVPTRLAKMVISGNGGSSKDNIQESVLNHPEIEFKTGGIVDATNLGEHEADSIAVAYAFCQTTLPQLNVITEDSNSKVAE